MNKVFVKRVLKEFIDLGEIEIKTGPFGTQLHASDYVEKGTAVINVRNIGYGRIKTDKLEYINEETVQRLSSHLLKHNDIVFGRKGAVDRHALIMPNQQGWFQGSDCLRIRIKSESLDPLFLSYYFLTDNHKKWMMAQCSHGATMASLNQDIISRISVFLPNIQIQQKIASILSNYDDLIENNTQRIEILEQMAKLVYEEWFIKFRFPGHEKVKMVSSELGEIPEGWNVKTLGELGKIITGKTPPTKNEENYGDYMPFVKTPDMHGNIFCISSLQSLSKIGESSQKNKTLPANTLLVSCIGTVGVVSITSAESQTNQQINALIPHISDRLEFLYFELKKLKAHLENLGSNGATLTNVNKEKFQSIKIISPDGDVIKNFHKIIYPIFNQIKTLQFKNQNLRKTRDLLLPKLISGEIDVSDLDISIRNEYQERNFNFGEPQDEKGLRFKMV